MSSHQQSNRTGAIARMLLYAAIVLSPLMLVALLRAPTDHSFIFTVGKNLALAGFTILALQFVLSARLKWIERPFDAARPIRVPYGRRHVTQGSTPR